MHYQEFLRSVDIEGINKNGIHSLRELPDDLPEDAAADPYDYWKSIDNPSLFLSPMTHCCGPSFRRLVQKHSDGATQFYAYSQMFTSDAIVYNDEFRENVLQSVLPDEKVILQLCGHNPAHFVRAAEILHASRIRDNIISLDVNLGCPATCASARNYGLYISQNWSLVHQIISALKKANLFRVSAKIRPLSDDALMCDYLKLLIYSGVSFICIHCRYTNAGSFKVQSVPPDYSCLNRIIDVCKTRYPDLLDNVSEQQETEAHPRFRVPIILNGGIRSLEDARELLQSVYCSGVAAGFGLLSDPACFSKDALSDRLVRDKQKERLEKDTNKWINLSREYLSIWQETERNGYYPGFGFKECRMHIVRMISHITKRKNGELSLCKDVACLINVVDSIEEDAWRGSECCEMKVIPPQESA